MKITGNIFANNYWLMKFAPLALALAAVVIFFCNLYVHIWNGAIIYLPLLFMGLNGNKLEKTVCSLLGGLLLINLICPYCIVLYFLFMALSLVAFFTGLFGFILNLGKQ
jgi:hypothetical protein